MYDVWQAWMVLSAQAYTGLHGLILTSLQVEWPRTGFFKTKKSSFATFVKLSMFTSSILFSTLFFFHFFPLLSFSILSSFQMYLHPLLPPSTDFHLIFLTIIFTLSPLYSTPLPSADLDEEIHTESEGKESIGLRFLSKEKHSSNWPLYTFPLHLNHVETVVCDRN